MHVKKACRLVTICLGLTLSAFSQSDRIGLDNKQYQLLDRLDIKLQNDSVFSFSTIKPYNRKLYTERVEHIDSLYKEEQLPVALK